MKERWQLFFYLMGYSTARLLFWLLMNVLTGGYSKATLGFLGNTFVIVTVVVGLVVMFGNNLNIRLKDSHDNK